jgi:polyisoprenoid-binding protein YceI
MKKLSLLLALTCLTITNAQTSWKIDPVHSTIRFAVNHMVISEVEGKFTSYEGNFDTSKEDFSDAKVEFKVDMNSINTDNAKRDGHLKSGDFFEVEKYPTMTFKSSSIEKIEDRKYAIRGNLTLHGITKEIILTMAYGGTIKDNYGNTKAGIKVTGELNRIDFGLKYNSALEAGGLMIGEDVAITCKLELKKI